MKSAIIEAALADEVKLRHFSSSISEQSSQGYKFGKLCHLEQDDVDCSKLGSNESQNVVRILVDERAKHLRKRWLFGLLALAVARQVATYIFRKREMNVDGNFESYIVFPSLSEPQFLLLFSKETLLSNLPLMFAPNRFINSLYRLMFYALHQFSVGNTDRERCLLKSGVGVAYIRKTIGETEWGRYIAEKGAFQSILILITSQKRIHFVSRNRNSISDVVVWDTDKVPNITIDYQEDSPFENYKFRGILGGRKLGLIQYYDGNPIRYTKKNFAFILSQLLLVQHAQNQVDKYSINTTLNVLREARNTFGLSQNACTYVCDQVQKMSYISSELFALKPQHGDFVPRNIISRKNGDLAIIDNSDDVKTGFFLTDVSTLILSFLAGEPSKNSSKQVECQLRSRKFVEMKNETTSQFELNEQEFLTGMVIGLVEKLRICEIEERQKVTRYWARNLRLFLDYFQEVAGSQAT